jgi:hypothetical protein
LLRADRRERCEQPECQKTEQNSKVLFHDGGYLVSFLNQRPALEFIA